jgi:hypothetical protein
VGALVTAQNKLYARTSTQLYEIGESTRLVTSIPASTLIAAAGNEMYFPIDNNGSGGIGVYDLASGAQRTVVSATAIVAQLLADTDHVFWVETKLTLPHESSVHAIGADGTGEVVLGSGEGIFQDDQALYWTTAAGDQIVRASKADLSSRIFLSTGNGFGAQAAYAGNVYWSPDYGKVASLPSDGSSTTPTVVVTLPVPPQGTYVKAIRFLGGTMYVELMQPEPGDCPGTCFYTARIVEIDTAAQVEIARADHVQNTPVFADGNNALYWALGGDVYRVR